MPGLRLRNPWIDPRVKQVRAASVRAYLLARGWRSVQTAPSPLEPFEKDSADGEPLLVSVPALEGARDYPQRVIELITDVALAENRYAVEVLDDILRQPTPATATTANGAGKGDEAKTASP